jgi:hypothetical protein
MDDDLEATIEDALRKHFPPTMDSVPIPRREIL